MQLRKLKLTQKVRFRLTLINDNGRQRNDVSRASIIIRFEVHGMENWTKNIYLYIHTHIWCYLKKVKSSIIWSNNTRIADEDCPSLFGYSVTIYVYIISFVMYFELRCFLFLTQTVACCAAKGVLGNFCTKFKWPHMVWFSCRLVSAIPPRPLKICL